VQCESAGPCGRGLCAGSGTRSRTDSGQGLALGPTVHRTACLTQCDEDAILGSASRTCPIRWLTRSSWPPMQARGSQPRATPTGSVFKRVLTPGRPKPRGRRNQWWVPGRSMPCAEARRRVKPRFVQEKFEIYFYPNGAVLLAPAACSGSRSRTTTRCHPRERAATRAGHIVTIAGTYTI